MIKQLLFLLLSFTTYTATAQSVVNGTPAGNNYPFFCTLVAADDTSTFSFWGRCGGSLIAPQWVLTAAHCAIDQPGGLVDYDSIDVVVSPPGIMGVYSPISKRLRSDFIIRYPGYDLTYNEVNDIALIHLRSPATVTPVVLPAQGNDSLSVAGTSAIVMGFGIRDTTVALIPSDTLLMAAIDIIHNDTCNAPQRHNGRLTPSLICAGKITGVATGSAGGDSGGPLFIDIAGTRTQVGIVSAGGGGFSYSNAAFPGIYTKVSAYRNWIDSVIDAYNHLPSGVRGSKKLATTISTSQKQLILNFNMPLPTTAALFIYDITGKMIRKAEIPARSNSYNTSLQEMSSGIYILKIALRTGEVQQHKFFAED